METDSTVIEEELLDEDVESTEVEDEAEVSEEPTEETDEETVQTPEWEKRFTQFKGDSAEEYSKNLEDAYGHSSTEATRLAGQVKELQFKLDQIASTVANNPEAAAQIMGQTPGQPAPAVSPLADPALLFARQTMEQQMEKEYNDFVKDYREMETDPTLAKNVIDNLSAVSEAYRVRNGRMINMAEGLRAAWVMAGKSLTDNEEEVRMAVKNTAGQSKAPAGRPTAPPEKPLFTKAQMDFAKRAWPEKTNDELVEMLSNYVQE